MATDYPYSLGEISDRLAIDQVIARYVHALDARDYDTLDDVFMPETRFDLTEAGGIADSWIEVKRYYQDNLEAFIDYQHVFSNVLLEFDIGRQGARSRSKVISPCGMLGGDGKLHHFEVVGWYEDGWRRMPDGWRIIERTWRHGWIWGDYPASRAARGVQVTQTTLRGDLIRRTSEHAETLLAHRASMVLVHDARPYRITIVMIRVLI